MGVLKVKSGGVWVPVAQGVGIASPGYVGHAFANAAQTNVNGTADVPGCSVTFTAIAGHTYKTTLSIGSFNMVGANGQLYASIANASNVQIRTSVIDVLVGKVTALHTTAIETGLTGTQTRKARLSGTAGNWSTNATAEYSAMIVVEDITPTIMDGNYPQLTYTNSPGGNAAANGSPIIMTHTTPLVPVGRSVIITWNHRFAQTTTAVFDLIMSASPGGLNATHQFGSGALNSGVTLTFQRAQAGTGSVVVAQSVLNTWGGQPVSYGAQSSITSLVI